jgi:branched-chain amino acid transport system permease protein
MATAEHVAGRATAGRSAWVRPGNRRQGLITFVLLLIALLWLPDQLSHYWMNVLTEVAVYALVALGLGLLMGRVGLVSLGQIAVLAIGAWIAARILYATSLPFSVVIILCGLGTGVVGTLVGLPALRVSGLSLALITLMLAGAISIVLANTNFPNGGTGFAGYADSAFTQTKILPIRRPSIALSDVGFFRYTVIVAVVMFLIALWHVSNKPGRAWASIRQSEPAALATGINITFYKLWAIVLASFITGVAGALLAGDSGTLYPGQFPTVQSISLLAVVLMGGMFSLWGAVVGGVLMQLLPAFLDKWNLPADLLTILFGVGVLQVLATAPAGLVDQFPKDMKRLGGLIKRTFSRGAPPPPEGASP